MKGSSYLGIIDDFIGADAKEATEEYDCTDIPRGVFSKCMRFFILRLYQHQTNMASSSPPSNDDHLRENGPSNAPHDKQDSNDITNMIERTKLAKDSGCIDDSELSKIGSGVGPNELQKIAVRYLKVPQPAIDTYKASPRYDKDFK